MTPDELKALLDKATRGPWKWIRDHSGLGGPWRLAPGVMWPSNSEATPDGDEIDRTNASLIALAPTLAAENIALREREARLADALESVAALLTEPTISHRVNFVAAARETARAVLAEIENEANGAP